MIDRPDTDSEPAGSDAEPAPVRRRGFNKLAWLLIVVGVAAIALMQNRAIDQKHPLQPAGSSAEDVAMLLQSRYIVGVSELTGDDPQLLKQISALNQGTVEQRLKFIVVSAELEGAAKALDFLEALDARLQRSNVELTEQQRELREAIASVLADYAEENWDAPSVAENQKKLLRDEMGWFGRLLLSPQQAGKTKERKSVLKQANRTLLLVAGGIGLGCFLFMMGFVAVLVVLVLGSSGKLKRRFAPADLPYQGIYAETFAVWLGLFLLLTRTAAQNQDENTRIWGVAAAMFASLLALVWPLIRGVSWRQLRQDIGWTFGRKPIVELLNGGVCYVVIIPLVFIGLVATIILMALSGWVDGPQPGANEFSPTPVPTHPIVDWIADADWLVALQLYLVAAVAAPVVEETMFRGVLYRNLRENSQRWGFLASFLFSAAVNCFIFAVVHPQGYVAVPVLMAIAFGLTLAREWRDTLIPSIVAHGIHNGSLITLLLLMLGE